jgi:hypothetical protein
MPKQRNRTMGRETPADPKRGGLGNIHERQGRMGGAMADIMGQINQNNRGASKKPQGDTYTSTNSATGEKKTGTMKRITREEFDR